MSLSVDSEQNIKEIAECINAYAKQISALELLAISLNIPINASPLTNFRDALNHYNKMFSNKTDEKVVLQQYSSIEEHLARGFKDIIVSISNILIKRIMVIYEKHILYKGNSMKVKYREILHRLKNINHKLRLESGIKLIRTFDDSPLVLKNIIKDYKVLLSDIDISHLLTYRFEEKKKKIS